MNLLIQVLLALGALVSVGVTLQHAGEESPLSLAGYVVWVALPYAHLLQQTVGGYRRSDRALVITAVPVVAVGLLLVFDPFEVVAATAGAGALPLLAAPVVQWLLIGLFALLLPMLAGVRLAERDRRQLDAEF